MVEIPESLLRRSAEAKAKALGVPVEQVLAEMKGEGPPVEVAVSSDPVPEEQVSTEPPAVEDASSEESPAAMVAETLHPKPSRQARSRNRPPPPRSRPPRSKTRLRRSRR